MNDLVVQSQTGHDAEKMLELVTSFNEEYHKAIVNNIMSCPTEDVDKWRNMLKAEEAFVSYLKSLVEDGNLARVGIKEINDEMAKSVNDNDYWW